MTRAQFYKELAERTGIPKKTIQEVIEAEENLVYEIMATCDSIKYIWGTVSGIEKPPKKMGGTVKEREGIWRNGGWSAWKIGYPNIKWSTASKICEKKTPFEFFEQPENRYTTLARTFRREQGLPEIPEYENLPEEKILEICEKADTRDWEKLTRKQQKNKLKDDKYNTIKKIAVARYWEETGYKPRGALYREDLGDLNYQGEQRDVISTYLMERVDKAETLPEKLEIVLNMRDYAVRREILDQHPELKELEDSLRKQIQVAGLQEIPHVVREYHPSSEFTLSFLTERDPWGINHEIQMRARELARKKREKNKQSEEEFIEAIDELDRPEYADYLNGRINYWEIDKILSFVEEAEQKEAKKKQQELEEEKKKLQEQKKENKKKRK